MSPATLSLPLIKPLTALSSPFIMACRFSRLTVTVQSVSRSVLDTLLGVDAPSSTITPSLPQSNLRVASRPLSAPILLRMDWVMVSRLIGVSLG